jgi:NADPH2:quinone reductase
MKAILVREFGEPSVMRIADVPAPTLRPGHVLVRLRAAGVNPVDTYVRKGVYARRPHLPYIPGADGAGVVAAVAPEVTDFAAGQRIYITGTVAGPFGSYAEMALCEGFQVHHLPDHVSFAQGAALGVPYGTAYRALMQRADALPGETVLVHGGSGGVGTAAVQIARAAGMQVLATAGTREGMKLLGDLGVDHAFNHADPDYTERILAATDGRGVDVVLEMLANVNLAKDLRLLARYGRVIVIGSRGSIEINPRDAMSREADIRGMLLFNTPPEEMARVHAAIVAGLRTGALKPVVGKEMPLGEAPRAHEAVMAPGAHGKIVLKID